LATAYFPQFYKGMSTQVYWEMGIASALGLFASIVIHEFSHSLVARRHGLPMKGITLFIFGGVAEMEEEPPNARTEFLMGRRRPRHECGCWNPVLLRLCRHKGLPA
jgi:Zn-dependent protease